MRGTRRPPLGEDIDKVLHTVSVPGKVPGAVYIDTENRSRIFETAGFNRGGILVNAGASKLMIRRTRGRSYPGYKPRKFIGRRATFFAPTQPARLRIAVLKQDGTFRLRDSIHLYIFPVACHLHCAVHWERADGGYRAIRSIKRNIIDSSTAESGAHHFLTEQLCVGT